MLRERSKVPFLTNKNSAISLSTSCMVHIVWIRRGGNEHSKNPKGEVGTLLNAIISNLPPYFTCFLVMEHRGTEYIGALLLDDRTFCDDVTKLLKAHRNRSIAEIGSMELSQFAAADDR